MKLLPCPFCGGGDCLPEQDERGWWDVRCHNSDCWTRVALGVKTKEWAISKWNTRPASVEATKEELLGIIAQGWCDPRNGGKVVDPDLAGAIVEALLRAEIERRKGGQ